MRGLVSPFLGSGMGCPVLTNAVRLSLTLAEGFWDLRIAQAPATCGAAMDVPSKAAKPPPGTDEVMTPPGARRLRIGALLEKFATKSDFVVAPTLMALEMQAGAEMPSAKPSFPEAMTVAMPTERRLSIIAFLGSVSREVENLPSPRLMLIAAIFNVLRNP